MNTKEKALKKIVELIEGHEKIVLFHHTLPDGDSISSSIALLKSIRSKYPEKQVYWMPHEEYLNKRFWYLDFDFKSTAIDKVDETWLGIVGDVSVESRVYNSEWLAKTGHKIVYDHHQNESTIENKDIFWHEPTYPASAIQSYEIAKALGVKMNEELAYWHLIGIITDTNRYLYSGSNPMPLRYAAELYEHISTDKLKNLYRSMYQKTMKSLKFQGWVYENFKIEDKVAFQKITKEDQDKLNMASDDCARVNLLENIEGVEAWLFFIQYPDFIRVEFRSKGVHVNEVALQFGGGGHNNAAGCKLEEWSNADKIIKATQDAVKAYLKK